MILDVARGLAYLHKNDILHRNIKPENMFKKGGVGKVGDFGFARLMKIGATRMTSAAGPPLYMSP